MSKCPYCPAEYSTLPELDAHLGAVGDHLRERLAESEASVDMLTDALEETKSALNECARQHGERRDRLVEIEDILRLAYPVLRQADQWSLVDRIDKIRG